MEKLKRWLSSPVSGNSGQNRIAFALRAVILSLIFGTALMIFPNLRLGEYYVAMGLTVSIFFFAFALYLTWRVKLEVAGTLLVLTLLSFVTYYLYRVEGGIQSEAIILYYVISLVAGLVLSGLWLYFTLAMMSLSLAMVIFGQINGIVAANPSPVTHTYFLTFATALTGITIAINRITYRLREALTRAEKNEQVLEETVKQLQQEISEHQRAQAEIKLLNAELENRVRLRTLQLETAMQELETFSYTVAHDLRSPLRGINGFSQIILNENKATLDEKTKKRISSILNSAVRMGTLIDSLLLFSRLTRAEFNKTPVNLTTLATDVVKKLQESQPERDVMIEIQAGLIAHADRKLIRIVLDGLLSNAWKFTSKTLQARIEFGSQEMDNEKVFFVRDNGAGFDMSYRNKLFGPFQRLHHIDEFPGEGAGLAIVQRIIHKHGGRIWAEGEVDKGATFYFTLPG